MKNNILSALLALLSGGLGDLAGYMPDMAGLSKSPRYDNRHRTTPRARRGSTSSPHMGHLYLKQDTRHRELMRTLPDYPMTRQMRRAEQRKLA